MTDARSTADPTVRELPIAAGGELDLRLGANRLRIRITDGDRVVLRGHTDHDLERDVEITTGTGWIRVTDGPQGSVRVGPITVRSGGRAPDLDVEVPRGVRISGRTLSGDIEAVGVVGPTRWQSASGDVRIGADGGPILVETLSGDATVEARNPLAVTCRTVSGRVRIRAPRVHALDVATTSGDVMIDAALSPGSSHAVTSVSGDLRLTTGSDVTVELQSVTGDIRSSLPHRIEGARGRRTVIVGSGKVRVGVKTMSGDVQLKDGAPDTTPLDPRLDATAAQASGAWSWADVAREWAESARGWAASWGEASPTPPKSRAADAAPRPAAADSSTAARSAPGAADAAAGAPEAPSTAAPVPAEAPTPGDGWSGVHPAGVAPVSEPEHVDDATSPVAAPTAADVETARLEILRALERGDLDVETAAERLAGLEGLAGHREG